MTQSIIDKSLWYFLQSYGCCDTFLYKEVIHGMMNFIPLESSPSIPSGVKTKPVFCCTIYTNCIGYCLIYRAAGVGSITRFGVGHFQRK
jgi:hypothetical protein